MSFVSSTPFRSFTFVLLALTTTACSDDEGAVVISSAEAGRCKRERVFALDIGVRSNTCLTYCNSGQLPSAEAGAPRQEQCLEVGELCHEYDEGSGLGHGCHGPETSDAHHEVLDASHHVRDDAGPVSEPDADHRAVPDASQTGPHTSLDAAATAQTEQGPTTSATRVGWLRAGRPALGRGKFVPLCGVAQGL